MELPHANEIQHEELGGQWRVEEKGKRRTRFVWGSKNLAWCVQKEVIKLEPDDRGHCARLENWT